jgi:MFS family permease
MAQAGLIYGLLQGFSAGIGTLAGGFITDKLGKRNAAWYALVPAIGIGIATPMYLFAYTRPTWEMMALMLLVPGILHYTYLAPTFAVVQNSVDMRRRATATALLFFVLNLLALGGGPPFVGWLIDSLAQWNFGHPGQHTVITSLKGMLGGHAGEFLAACPGGKAPAGSSAELVSHCRTTLAQSTKQGLVLGSLFYGWAALHYFLAAIGMRKHMRQRMG